MGDIPETITIPKELKNKNVKVTIKEGAVEAIKGNYNEALVCKYIIDNHKKSVTDLLSEADGDKKYDIIVYLSDYEKAKNTINPIVEHWDNKLKKDASTKYNEIKKAIELASLDMAKYLVKKAKNDECVIISIELDNLSFQEGDDIKRDIRVTLEKENKKFIEDYSLKFYKTKDVNLSNSTAVSLVRKLTGNKEIQTKVKDRISTLNSKEIASFFDSYKTFIQNIIKKLNGGEDIDNYVSKSLPIDNYIIDGEEPKNIIKNIISQYSDKTEQINALNDEVTSAREQRGLYRTEANPEIAAIVYDELNSFISDENNKSIFIKNLSKTLGMEDDNTKILMAIVNNSQLKSGKICYFR